MHNSFIYIKKFKIIRKKIKLLFKTKYTIKMGCGATKSQVQTTVRH